MLLLIHCSIDPSQVVLSSTQSANHQLVEVTRWNLVDPALTKEKLIPKVCIF